MKNLLSRSLVLAVFTSVLALSAAAQVDHALLNELIQVSSSGHTFRHTLPDFVKPPVPEVSKIAAKFDPVLAANTKLTPEQKEFVKTNYLKLGSAVNDRLAMITLEHFKFSDWLTAYLREAYPKELTANEMRAWIDFFKTTQGKLQLDAVLAYPQPTDPETNELIKKFSSSPIGVKYMQIFGDQMTANMQVKMDDAAPSLKPAIEQLFTAGELNSIVEKFVAVNYKKP